MRSLILDLRWLFQPNPGNATYEKMLGLIVLSAALILLSFIIRFWRGGVTNPATKKLSSSWSSVAFWFGIAGLILVVSRVEGVQFIAMRFLWVIWGVLALLYIAIQIRQFRQRHYEIIPTVRVDDPREKYLPGKKKR